MKQKMMKNYLNGEFIQRIPKSVFVMFGKVIKIFKTIKNKLRL